jgi:hypothetical protein
MSEESQTVLYDEQISYPRSHRSADLQEALKAMVAQLQQHKETVCVTTREPAAVVNDDSGFDADFPEAGDDGGFAACFEDTEQDDGEVADVEQAAAEDDSAATADAGQGTAHLIYHHLSMELSRSTWSVPTHVGCRSCALTLRLRRVRAHERERAATGGAGSCRRWPLW